MLSLRNLIINQRKVTSFLNLFGYSLYLKAQKAFIAHFWRKQAVSNNIRERKWLFFTFQFCVSKFWDFVFYTWQGFKSVCKLSKADYIFHFSFGK